MKIVGLITEYNPFHNGHKHHLQTSKKESNCDYSIAIMSGNFVQRGEPAIVDKWHRAKMAVDSGVDLVLELPTVYATMSAEFFAFGAIRLLDSLNVVDTVAFGSESNNMEYFFKIADTLLDESSEFKSILKDYLDEGLSFPQARAQTLREILNSDEVYDIVNNPNNILAIEYIKALRKIKSNIKPHSIQRIVSNYNDSNLTGEISSATSIRNVLLNNGFMNEDAKSSLPNTSIEALHNFLDKYDRFNSLSNFNDILLYKLRTISPNYLNTFIDIEGGLENRILAAASTSDNINSIIDSIKTKRYTYTRLQRILTHILLDINYSKNDILNFPIYARILASNSNGFKIINQIKNNSDIQLVNKVSNFINNNSNPFLELDIKASNIYFLGLNNKTRIKNNFDFYISPYIKNS